MLDNFRSFLRGGCFLIHFHVHLHQTAYAVDADDMWLSMHLLAMEGIQYSNIRSTHASERIL